MSRSAFAFIILASVAGLALVASAAQRAPSGRAQPRVPQPGTGQTAAFVQSAYLSYVGAFRLPGPSGPGGPLGDLHSFNGGGEALTYNAANRTLLLTGSRCCQPTTVAEIAIPEIRQTQTIAELATATYRQPHTAILGDRQRDVGCGGPLGGLMPWSGSLVVSVYCYYDAAYIQTRSHFRSSLDFSATLGVVGPVEIATGIPDGGRAGFVSGYMASVPPEWQAALGGPAVTGNCCLPIITRTSWGPALSVFDPADIGVRNPVPATTLIRYTDEHPTLGRCESDGDVPTNFFNCTTNVVSVVMPRGTSSVLFFGSHGTGKHCYGSNTNDPAKHRAPDPEVPGEMLCYDPGRNGKGPHAYPYVHMVWAYSVSDLIAVKNRQKQPWQITPYATWTFDTPFSIPGRFVTGVAYDEAEQRVFVSMGEQDAPRPLIHVFKLQLTPTTATADQAGS